MISTTSLNASHSVAQKVECLIKDASFHFAMPLYGRSESCRQYEKAPGEVVCDADLQIEAWLGPRLIELLPNSDVLGEEGTISQAADAASPAAMCWVIDPIDGTSNFVAGTGPFAICVALVEFGRTVGSWIFEPLRDRIWSAYAGAGAYRNGERICLEAGYESAVGSDLSGLVENRVMPMHVRTLVTRNFQGRGKSRVGLGCAAAEYARLLDREMDFAFFWRVLPWDHAPGALLLSEAGGFVADIKCRSYSLETANGLLAAVSRSAWSDAVQRLFGDTPAADRLALIEADGGA